MSFGIWGFKYTPKIIDLLLSITAKFEKIEFDNFMAMSVPPVTYKSELIPNCKQGLKGCKFAK